MARQLLTRLVCGARTYIPINEILALILAANESPARLTSCAHAYLPATAPSLSQQQYYEILPARMATMAAAIYLNDVTNNVPKLLNQNATVTVYCTAPTQTAT